MKSRIVIPALLVCIGVALSGCAGMRLYDKSKANVATAIKTKYAEADILGTIEAQKMNLEALLAEELRVVRENHQLQVDFALLELADNDSPMAVTWRDEIETPIGQLGFTTGQELRDSIVGLEEAHVRDRQMAGLRRRVVKRVGTAPPSCKPEMPDEMTIPEGIDERTAGRANKTYARLKEVCTQKLTALMSVKLSGKWGKAINEWEAAQKELDKRDEKILKARFDVDAIAAKHKAAVKLAMDDKKKGDALRKAIKNAADKLTSALETAAKLAPGVLAEERLSSIIVLLQAAAGEQVEIGDDPELAKAVLMVGGLSSLSGDVADLVASAKAPSVRNLLIELQHQTVLLEHAKALRSLQKQRVDIRETKYKAYLREAILLLDFRNAMCSFAFRYAAKGHPGKTCDQFEVSTVGSTDASTVEVTCNVGQATIAKTENSKSVCALSKSWKEFLETPPREKGAKRQFYKALAAFTQIFPVRASQIEQNFNLIDLKHRENLATREMALKAWNNLAAVPIDQLDAYFQSGLKPEVIADLIVKALGFAAITVGVSQ